MTDLQDAARSPQFIAVAAIAGGKAHKVAASTLLEDATEKYVRRQTFRGGRYVPVWRTRELSAGTVLYSYPLCGTTRATGRGFSYDNSYAPADEVTCAKCAKLAD